MNQLHHTVSARHRVWLLRAVVALGVLALAYYFSWWVDAGRVFSPLLMVALMLAALYSWAQLLGSWRVYLAARPPSDAPPVIAAAHLTTDVFVTACNEPLEMIEQTLRAAVAMRGNHRTWLLDDGDHPQLARLAETLGIGYLTRQGNEDRKAGNLNAALRCTDGDVIVVFDADHVPAPEFLERSLGHFVDPRVGFVQVMLTYANQNESWFSRGAAEMALDFFNPTTLGMDQLGSATMHGSNSLIRRSALESIDGYRTGLAEDLATSIALHGAGWKAAYVAEPLAPGLAPTELVGWFTQQLKWARGVFEVLIVSYPRLFGRLTWGQRLSYAVRMTCYWAGPVVAIHMALTVGLLVAGDRVAQINFQSYLVRLFLLAFATFAIRTTALWCWRHPSVRRCPVWRGPALVQATWPVYTLAWAMALLRLSLRFRATPKTGRPRRYWKYLLPQASSLALLGSAAGIALAANRAPHIHTLLALVVLQAYPQLMLAWQAVKAPSRNPQPAPLRLHVLARGLLRGSIQQP